MLWLLAYVMFGGTVGIALAVMILPELVAGMRQQPEWLNNIYDTTSGQFSIAVAGFFLWPLFLLGVLGYGISKSLRPHGYEELDS